MPPFFIMATSRNLKDRTGMKFGQLNVLRKNGYIQERVGWLCACDCGNRITVNDQYFKKVTITCGCHLLINKTSKVCALCGIEKDKSEYHPCSRKACGVQSKCIECVSEYKKNRYWSNRDEELAKMTKSRLKPENIEQRKGYYKENKKAYKKRYLTYMADDDKKENKKKVSEEYRIKNADTLKVKARIHSQKPHVKRAQREYHLKRKATDIRYNLARNLRSRVRRAIKAAGKGAKKYGKSMELIGCDLEFVKNYIENQFTEGMSWERISEIHIDHIKPLKLFDLTKKEEQLIAFNYRNLQPLWAEDNLKKNAKYPYVIQSRSQV